MPKTLRVELHSHTEYSYDGHIRFDGMVEMAWRRKLDAIAITDHDTVDGALEFCRLHNRRGTSDLCIIVGQECTLSDKTHVIGIFLRETIRAQDLRTAMEQIADQGGVCVIPHPYRRISSVFASPSPDVPTAPLCFEIFNPTCSYGENRAASALVDRGLIAVGGSDAHYGGQLGECVNQIPFHSTVEASVREALTRRGFVTVFGVRQIRGGAGRTYTPALYRRIKPYIDLPPSFKPVTARMFNTLRDSLKKRRNPNLEIKWEASQAGFRTVSRSIQV